MIHFFGSFKTWYSIIFSLNVPESLNYLEFIFVYEVKQKIHFLPTMCLINCMSSITDLSRLLGSSASYQLCIDMFLGSLFPPIGLVICLCFNIVLS